MQERRLLLAFLALSVLIVCALLAFALR